MKLKLEIELGNEAMQTVAEVNSAVQRTLEKFAREHVGFGTHLVTNDGGLVSDINGNRVGVWGVEA